LALLKSDVQGFDQPDPDIKSQIPKVFGAAPLSNPGNLTLNKSISAAQNPGNQTCPKKANC
jgi:hypothetical protein